jgi:hypothetical protein
MRYDVGLSFDSAIFMIEVASEELNTRYCIGVQLNLKFC